MDIAAFSASPSGRLITTIEGSQAFVPNPLPPTGIDFTAALGNLAVASQALGELNGIGRTLINPYLLIRPLQRREALSSSSMEGTYTTLSELVLLEAGASEASMAHDTREVLNYVRALETSISRLDELPLSLRIIREAHEVLLRGVGRHRGAIIRAGELKRDQNRIGGKGKIATARFVPPPPKQAEEAMSDLEKYVNRQNRDEMPALIDAALAHYQFETIHPFPDGNGRVGRMFITLMLMERRALVQPLLYMSPFFEENKDEYIDLMYQVSCHGSWIPWINFFLRAVTESCQQTIKVVERLQDLQKSYRDRFQRARGSALALRIIDLAFERPARSIPEIAELLEVSWQGASNNINNLIDAGIAADAGMKHPRIIVFPEILAALEPISQS